MLKLPRPEATRRVRELERPEEVAGLLEVGPDGHDLVHQILHADDAELAQVLLDDLVVGQRDALLVDLAVAALVDEVADAFDRWEAVGDVRLDDLEHFRGRFGQFHENAVVDLEEAEELHDLAGLGCHFVDLRGHVRPGNGAWTE